MVVVDTDDTDTWSVLPLLYNIARALDTSQFRAASFGWKLYKPLMVASGRK